MPTSIRSMSPSNVLTGGERRRPRIRAHHADRVKRDIRSIEEARSMAHTIALALAAAVYPTILAGVIVLLRQENPRPLLLGFWLGGMFISIAAGIAVIALLEQTNKTIDTSSTTRPVLDITLGVLSLALAYAVWTGHTGRL